MSEAERPDTVQQAGVPGHPPSALDLAVERLDQLVRSFEDDPHPAVHERVMLLLQAVDAVHRPGIERLAGYLDAAVPGLRESALSDPAVRLLFELYELLPAEPSRSAQAPPPGFVPLSQVRILRGAGRHG